MCCTCFHTLLFVGWGSLNSWNDHNVLQNEKRPANDASNHANRPALQMKVILICLKYQIFHKQNLSQIMYHPNSHGMTSGVWNKLLIFDNCSGLCRGGYPGGGGHIRIWGGQVQSGVDAEGGVHHQARDRAIDQPPHVCEPWDDGPAGPSKMRRKWPQSSCS